MLRMRDLRKYEIYGHANESRSNRCLVKKQVQPCLTSIVCMITQLRIFTVPSINIINSYI